MSNVMKKKVVKKGVPLAAKGKADFMDPGFSLDPYKLPSDLQEELDKKGLVGRFINGDILRQNGGYHPRGWRPYKRDVIDNTEFSAIFGSDPDGYIRRGQSILGVKTKEEVEKHRAYLAHQAKLCSHTNYNKRSRAAMRDSIREYGLEEHIQVVDGYED